MSSRFTPDDNLRLESTPADNGAGETEDLDLVRQLQAGNHDAFTSLFEKYSGMVFSIARRMLQNSSEAEEVVQQVFLDTYRAIHQFDSRKGSYKTWLFQFAYHRTINRKQHLQTKGFYSCEELDEEQLPAELYEGAGQRLRLNSPEVVQLIQQLLSSIPPRQRLAIELTFFEGLTAQEISNRTGETAAAVRHHLYRGLDKLRVALSESERHQKSHAKREIERMILADPTRLL
jgi:RNA polymerase sigma-70 factor (ECF subfamily)